MQIAFGRRDRVRMAHGVDGTQSDDSGLRMSGALEVLIGPICGLAGVLAGIYYSNRRWKAEIADQRRKEQEQQQAAFVQKEREAYLGLWGLTVTMQQDMKRSESNLMPDEFAAAISDIHDYMLREGLYISPDDRRSTVECLFWAHEYYLRVANIEAQQLKSPLDVLTSDPQLLVLAKRLNDARKVLRDRVQAKLGGPGPTGWDQPSQVSTELLEKLNALIGETNAHDSERASARRHLIGFMGGGEDEE